MLFNEINYPDKYFAEVEITSVYIFPSIAIEGIFLSFSQLQGGYLKKYPPKEDEYTSKYFLCLYCMYSGYFLILLVSLLICFIVLVSLCQSYINCEIICHECTNSMTE